MILSLGVVTVVTPGTPVRATVHESDPTARRGAQRIRFQAMPSNAGVVYVGLDGLDVSPTGLATGHLLAVLAGPASPITGPFDVYEAEIDVNAGMNAADFYVDAVNGGDAVVVSLLAN